MITRSLKGVIAALSFGLLLAMVAVGCGELNDGTNSRNETASARPTSTLVTIYRKPSLTAPEAFVVVPVTNTVHQPPSSTSRYTSLTQWQVE